MESTKLIFGSTAMKYWWSYYDKIPNDLDYIVTEIPKHREAGVEYFKSIGTTEIIKINENQLYVDPDLLYTIKVSHLPWEGNNGKWWKHLKDAVFMKNGGCQLNKRIYDLLYKDWQNLYGDKSNVSLNVATEMFFKDGVRREFDHDWLHEYFAVNAEPAYKSILKDSSTPLCSEEYFLGLDDRMQLLTGLEEMFVVGYERNISLPNAFKNLVTRQTKGWWTLFLLEHTEILLDGFLDEKLTYKLLKEKLNGTIHSKTNY